MDAINHIDRVILSLQDDLKESQDYESKEVLHALCHQDEIADYEERAWKLGELAREKMRQVHLC